MYCKFGGGGGKVFSEENQLAIIYYNALMLCVSKYFNEEMNLLNNLGVQLLSGHPGLTGSYSTIDEFKVDQLPEFDPCNNSG